MEVSDYLHVLFRWIHIVAGITWIGLLYFFNWVNSAFAPTMDGETKKKVVPELLPRTLFWFRWGAAYTWISGVVLLLLVFYHGGLMFEGGEGWSTAGLVMVAWTFLAVFVYDAIFKAVPNEKVGIAVGFLLTVLTTYLFKVYGGFGYRALIIHTGAMFGTIMAYNVWFRIWPAQQKIIMGAKNGTPVDAALPKLAGMRSKHNTYLSVPLVWAMMNQHTVMFAGQWWSMAAATALGWFVVWRLYGMSKKVKGF